MCAIEDARDLMASDKIKMHSTTNTPHSCFRVADYLHSLCRPPPCLLSALYFSFPFFSSHQGSKFVVAMVANATMYSHLLPGCSCGSKHLLLP